MTDIMTGSRAEARIHEFERFGSKLGLERMNALMDRLGHPERGLRVIHVAGTNGKGSVCRYIYEALIACGYSVGLYISPYIEKFNERIELDGQIISDDDLDMCADKALAAAKDMVEAGLESPTEFEVTTAAAFVYYAMKKPDFTVLEVGLGGRGDSTNVIADPVMTIITSISYDHTDRLGTTLAEIAYEKAGIIKPGVTVVSNVPHGRKDPEDVRQAARVIAKAAYAAGSRLCDVTKLDYTNAVMSAGGSVFDTRILGTVYDRVEISMAGEHQIQNAMTALYALEILRRDRVISVTKDTLYAGIKKARQPGRFEIIHTAEKDGHKCDVIIDGAHNVSGAEALRDTVNRYYDKVLMVTGILADKDVPGILERFGAIADDFIATEPDSPRRLASGKLCEMLRAMGKNCEDARTTENACDMVRGRMAEYDAVLFAGSLYMIGKVRGIFRNENGG